MNKKLFLAAVFVFLASCIMQGMIWKENDMIDAGVWADEAMYVATGDSRGFEGGAYGYPGGPVIDGTIAIHAISGLSYHDSLLVFVTLFDSLVITLCCLVAYAIQKNMWWGAALLASLPLAPMFEHSTPTSAASSLMAVLVCLLTLYLLKDPPTKKLLLWWGIAAGVMLSIRIDVAGVMIGVFGLLILFRVGWKKLLVPAVAALLVFCALDPFLWMIPVKHVGDMVTRITFHYFEYSGAPVQRSLVIYFSLLAFVGMGLAAAQLFSRKDEPLPRTFSWSLLLMSVFLYWIFLTAHSQAMRYFQPVIFIWEALLPFLLFYFIPRRDFKFLIILILFVRSLITYFAWLVQ